MPERVGSLSAKADYVRAKRQRGWMSDEWTGGALLLIDEDCFHEIENQLVPDPI